MKISTKGRYALRVIIDLAQHDSDEYLPLKEISERQEVSIKYLEMIVAVLQKAGLVMSQRGKSGGYKLSKSAKDYTVGSILKLMEGSLAPVFCLEHKENVCSKSNSCITLPMWQKLDKMVDDYLESVTIEDLITQQIQSGCNDYNI